MIITLCILLFVPVFASSPPQCEDVGIENQIVDIASGGNHLCILLKSGRMRCSGLNDYGQLGSRNRNEFIDFGTDERVTKVAAGHYHTCALFEEKKMKCWGSNYFGELGLGESTKIGSESEMLSLAEVDVGHVDEDIQEIFCDSVNTCVLFGNGKLKCWGDNTFGQLARGDTETIGDGANEMGDNLQFVDLQTGSLTNPRVLLFAHGGSSNMVLLEGGVLKGWGNNRDFVLKDSDDEFIGDTPDELGVNLPEIDVGVPEDGHIHHMCTSSLHACLIYSTDTGTLSESRHVKCWGKNVEGVMGLGKKEEELPHVVPNSNVQNIDLGDGLIPIQVYCEGWRSCVLFDTGQVKCWGYNYGGQLGLGDTQSRGDDLDEMGNNLEFLDFGEGRRAVKLVSGNSHTCALLDNARISCWGVNGYQVLEQGEFHIWVPTNSFNRFGCTSRSCFDDPCPNQSTCKIAGSAPTCVCNHNYINTNSPEGDTSSDPVVKCVPKFHASATLQSPEILKVSVSKLVPDYPEVYYLGIAAYQVISDGNLHPVKLFQGHRILVSPYSSSPSERLFGPLEPGFKYEILIFPLKFDGTSSEPVRDGEYFQKLEVETICDCARLAGNSTERLGASAYQVEGVVLFRFPDITRCEDQYEVSRRVDRTTKNIYLSTYAVEPAVCATKYIEPQNRVEDDLRVSKLIVGKTYKYDVLAVSRNSLSPRHEPITIQHTIHWEASVVVHVTDSETAQPVRGVGIWYQLRSFKDEVISECVDGKESTLSDLWCRADTGPDGTIRASFQSTHPSLTNDNEATIHIRFESGVLSGRCNSLTSECGFDDGVVVNVKHLSFNVPVKLFLGGAEAVDDSVTIVAISGGILGSVFVISALVVFGLKKKRSTVLSAPIGDVFDKNTNTFVPRQQ